MTDSMTVLAEELAAAVVRARRAEERVDAIEQILDAVGATMWQTDRDLCLVLTAGHRADPRHLRQHVATLYEDLYGVTPSNDEPILAHCDARAGESVTFLLQGERERFAVLVEPRCDEADAIVGTVGLALRLERVQPGTTASSAGTDPYGGHE